ncbi:hypothetical protein LIP_3331 [Limnochorda pilosa]|uniref:DnaJ homologue subfamily C member 28 conserved domain-containing protein n=1 Tax=Limnochorda pilosa TaxID=1555112 RepID=A0A0K2SQS1_LIMPI|nr:hypothetical protein LIP_3331 [Limnochorda pilosa]
MTWVELVAEARIQEAMERGEFDDLPPKGRPLEMEEFPFVPPHLRMPYKLLHDAGFAPDWIELDKEIRELKERFAQLTTTHGKWLEREWEAWSRMQASASPEAGRAARARRGVVREAHAEALAEAHRLLEQLNATVDRFNRVVPHILWQKGRWPARERLDAFVQACERAFPGLGGLKEPGPRPDPDRPARPPGSARWRSSRVARG